MFVNNFVLRPAVIISHGIQVHVAVQHSYMYV